MEQTIGSVLSIAVRTAERGPMREITEAKVVADGGINGDIPVKPERGVSFLSARQWAQVRNELGADLPWHTRRANVLVDADSLGGLIGQTVSLGGVRVQIEKETKPCYIMDEIHEGLRSTLVPDFRGGVLGRVVQAGTFHIGDPIRIVAT